MISERAFARSFDSFWHELLPLLTPRFVALFNEAYESVLLDQSGRELAVLPVPAGMEQMDVIAEFAFRLAQSAHEQGVSLDLVKNERALIAKAESEAFELIQRYEGRRPVETTPLSEAQRAEGLRLCGRYAGLYMAFDSGSSVHFCPSFRGAGFLNSCEGDVATSDCLIEVKTTSRKPAGRDIRQLIVYAALDANAGTRRWAQMGIFNPRRGTLHRVRIDPLVLRLSGGKPSSDVFADLVAFAESNEPAIDRRL